MEFAIAYFDGRHREGLPILRLGPAGFRLDARID